MLQPPFDPSVGSLCHPWFTTSNLSYRRPIFETYATALCGTTGAFVFVSFFGYWNAGDCRPGGHHIAMGKEHSSTHCFWVAWRALSSRTHVKKSLTSANQTWKCISYFYLYNLRQSYLICAAAHLNVQSICNMYVCSATIEPQVPNDCRFLGFLPACYNLWSHCLCALPARFEGFESNARWVKISFVAFGVGFLFAAKVESLEPFINGV